MQRKAHTDPAEAMRYIAKAYGGARKGYDYTVVFLGPDRIAIEFTADGKKCRNIQKQGQIVSRAISFFDLPMDVQRASLRRLTEIQPKASALLRF